MAFRPRIYKPREPVRGYPDLLFRAYVHRFGVVEAAFYTPGMRMLTREYVRAPVLPMAAIRYFHYKALEALIEQRDENDLDYEMLMEVLSNWPDDEASATLRSHTFEPFNGS